MNATAKSVLLLLVTLALGVTLGLLGGQTWRATRMRDRERMRGPGGFVEQAERVIQPRDSAQRAAIRPILLAVDSFNRATIEGSNAALRARFDSARRELAPLLDAAQAERLEQMAKRPPPPPGGGPGGPGGPRGPGGPDGRRPPPPDGMGPPPDGMGPPPDGRGPPPGMGPPPGPPPRRPPT
ncbi:MAG: hypothetical protein K2X99_08115 [Gemmatimonadaceae bacterium]|nr:hypothetical protein [Gemmatimonadaceae bacterium]